MNTYLSLAIILTMLSGAIVASLVRTRQLGPVVGPGSGHDGHHH